MGPKSAARARAPRPAPASAEEREPRGARRKRETRMKLLRSAFRLFGERGVDAVAINEITEAADVGFGSFYNHFASKEAIYGAVVDAVFGEFGDTLDRATADVTDPAEVIAICVRQTILRAHAEPKWGQFFVREGLSTTAVTRGLGARLMRDIARAIAARRIDVADPMMALMLAGGCVLATVAVDAGVVKHGTRAAKQVGFDTKDLASRAAAAILAALGLERSEAAKLAAKPLPKLETKPMFE
jgi:AcrR family transcriptional regulator